MWLLYTLTTVHVIVCLFLILVVLLQSGKAADLAGAFGGMGSQTAFGPRGATTALSRATTIAAILFMMTSISLSVMASRRAAGGGTGSVLEKNAPTTQSAPAKAPASTPSAPAPANQAPASQAPATPAPSAPVKK